jgi:hypothetical protein
MKKSFLLLALFVPAVVFSPLRADAQSTYTTTNGTVNLVVGLTNLSSATAIGVTNQSVGIDYITDSSWSTGIENLGALTGGAPNNGTLAGTFGGGSFFGTNNGIILIGIVGNLWGSWTIRLLLSGDTYSSPSSFSTNNMVQNAAVLTAPDSAFFANATSLVPAGSIISAGSLATWYQELDIAAFDSNNIGFKGIELSNMGSQYPDVAYIGVTGVIPEPSTYALLALSAAGLGGYVLRRRK